MKVYLMTDLEGVAGVWDWDDRNGMDAYRFDELMRMRGLLTNEVNAAVEGFVQGGASEVIVNDGHGYGNTILVEDLHPRAQLIHGQGRPAWLPLLTADTAMTGLVGAHPRAGTARGNLRHTMSHLTIRKYVVNGIEMGEIGFQALGAGTLGVPFGFLSGDRWACEEVEALLPGVSTVAVKEGLGERAACCLSPKEACRRITEGARACLKAGAFPKPLDLGSPVVFREERIHPDFDTEPEPADPRIRILSSHVREITTETVDELSWVLFGMPCV